MTQAPQEYSATAITLHWLIALLIFAAFPLGVYMHDLPISPARLKLVNYHKWLGLTVFTLAFVRALWRLGHPPPAPPASMPLWQQRASALLHNLLYVLILAIPVSGWLMSSAQGLPTSYLGLVQLPDLLDRDKALGEQLVRVHRLLNLGLLLLVVVHVLAALKHQFIDRDGVLARMIPFLSRSA